MISFKEAISIIDGASKSLKTIKCDILESLGMICSENIKAKINVPSFDNSAMDGYGVKTAWLANATHSTPIKIEKKKIIAAGDFEPIQDENATCHIMTGAKCPTWVEAVVPIEKTKIDDTFVSFFEPVKHSENLRRIGEDSKIGEILINKGTMIKPEHIMVLASQGINEIAVFEKPKIKIIATGNELQPYNSGELENGKIYNSNAPYLLSKAKHLGLDAEFVGIFQDDISKFADFLDRNTHNSIIISSGAVSAGLWDFVPEALKLVGAKVHFHKVNIRPGKPILFATLKNGSLFFGLPGNPISSAIGFEFFVKQALSNLMAIEPTQDFVSISNSKFAKKFKGTQFLKAKTLFQGKYFETEILNGQESFKIKPFGEANSWVILDEDVTEIALSQMLQFKFFN
ncbi:molybdopterin molybdotransferase MoeA [Pseudaquidulcibacter saccharophilus]|uniref:molybdopterin molybdotransferase MoeA n=1 Tax=Pseudaquidulcibacter saccharophilus TaxID=2831900 RepID=UPI001EFF2C47|nr:molybdopterin molybdotransferase MoeA [Pseudaquidulcibacter saccharophilus]